MSQVSVVIPRVGVSVAAFRGSELLIIRRGKPPFFGFWSLPGGAVEPGETLRDAALRELLEETGLFAAHHEFVDNHEIIQRNDAGALTVHFVAAVFRAVVSGEPIAADDAADARFIDPDDLDRFETTPGLDRVVARARRP